MIGHLQRNKVKPLLPFVHMIHSIDSLRLAEELDAQSAKLGRRIPVMLQVNASEEPQKHGVAVGAAVHLAEQIDSMPNLQLVGLMTMAPFDAEEKVIRLAFGRTREIFEEMRWHKIGGTGLKHLSMGMSNDFEHAIAEGSTMVRIGTDAVRREGRGPRGGRRSRRWRTGVSRYELRVTETRSSLPELRLATLTLVCSPASSTSSAGRWR